MLASFTSRHFNVLVRILCVVFGGVAVVWGLVTLPMFARQAPIEYIAQNVIRGQAYKIDVLKSQLPAIEAVESSPTCHPTALWSAAIIRLRILEQTERIERLNTIDMTLNAQLNNSIRRSLFCSAAEPFLWLILYWSESRQSNFENDYARVLRMSYQVGPNEGWVALKRNPVAFADYERLPPDLKMQSIVEFLALVNNGFYQQAADILGSSARSVQTAVLRHLTTLPQRRREAFARVIHDRRVDIDIRP